VLYLKNNGSTSIIYLNLIDTLDDNALVTPGWSWLINFTNDFTKESYQVLQILNQSAFRLGNTNMVKMPITVDDTGVPKATYQKIVLIDEGYYTYQIFLQDSLTNVDIEAAEVIRVVQNGKALIYNTPEVEYRSEVDGNPNNFIYVP
tara:strand:- start:278 stop:718 length:441 start_codon:yes stop_codon:yes gene_type:complete